MVSIVMIFLVSFVLLSMLYVYKYRGEVRYENFSEYLRKGWPLFTPLNCVLYMFTEKKASKPIMQVQDFPEMQELEKHWQTIRDEAVELYKQKYFEATNSPDNAAYYDVGFRTFYKYGWSKFYLKWYGYTHDSAKKLCPKTVEILSQFKTVNGAMFSVLPPGSQLTRHLDPVAASLRYHLGLTTPGKKECFINIDGKDYFWKDGESLIFDETYLHYAKNNTDEYRLILMCDIERPMNIFGKIFNFFYSKVGSLAIVPNLEGDKKGFANLVFSKISPILKKSKDLKQTNRPAYLALKYTVNTTLILGSFFLIYEAIYLIAKLIAKI